MTQRRVAVTGIGVICALGNNRADFWNALCAGTSGIRTISSLDPARLRYPNVAEISGLNPADHLPAKQRDLLDRFSLLALIAAREAIMDAGLDKNKLTPIRAAVITGAVGGGSLSLDHGYQELYARKQLRVSPLTIPRIMPCASASWISIDLGITGPALTISTACASSAHALGFAFWMVRNGLVDLAIAGGSEAPFSYGNLKAWEALRVLSDDTCRPFSTGRTGTILGEGAAILVLESERLALARGARIYAESSGFGMSSDASHLVQPASDGAFRAMRAALEDAGLTANAIAHINAHGTGTVANDIAESQAIRRLFREHTENVWVTSTKSAHGHTLGAAGAIEAAATVLALSSGTLPPTINFLGKDKECDLQIVPSVARNQFCEHALSNSFAFGGLNATLAFRRSHSREDIG